MVDAVAAELVRPRDDGGAGGDDEALAELKAKMGLLEGPKNDTKALGAGDAKVAATKDAGSGATSAPAPAPAGGAEDLSGLTAEDLKELEDLDLSEYDKSAGADKSAG